MVDLKTLSERIIRSNKPGLGGQIGPDRPVILNRIRRSFSGGSVKRSWPNLIKNLWGVPFLGNCIVFQIIFLFWANNFSK